MLGTSLLLLTCRHLFDDGASAGDLGLPLGDTGRILWLKAARPRVLVDPAPIDADLGSQPHCGYAAKISKLPRHADVLSK